MMQRRPSDPPTLNELACLNAWPEGTAGFALDRQAIEALHQLCGLYGYGRMRELMEGIEAICRDPSQVAAYQADREERVKRLGHVRRDWTTDP